MGRSQTILFRPSLSESSPCQEDRKDHMSFDRKLSVSVDHDRVRFSLL
jgi:hypothetical protein